jgi:hypothetical protein
VADDAAPEKSARSAVLGAASVDPRRTSRSAAAGEREALPADIPLCSRSRIDALSVELEQRGIAARRRLQPLPAAARAEASTFPSGAARAEASTLTSGAARAEASTLTSTAPSPARGGPRLPALPRSSLFARPWTDDGSAAAAALRAPPTLSAFHPPLPPSWALAQGIAARAADAASAAAGADPRGERFADAA